MKCPKCGYLGFEHVDRCRNCGYDFSFTSPSSGDILELSLRAEPEPSAPIEDLSFLSSTVASEPVRTSTVLARDRESTVEGNTAPALTATELPLFGAPIPDDLPLITKPSPPRPPLAVRRATPEVPRLRSVPTRAITLGLGLEPPERAAA